MLGGIVALICSGTVREALRLFLPPHRCFVVAANWDTLERPPAKDRASKPLCS